MPAVAAAWKYNSGHGVQMKQKIEQQAAKLLSYGNIGARISQVDDILKRKAEHALFSTSSNEANADNGEDLGRKEKVVKELLKKVKKRRKLVRSYSYFSWFCAFFACFLGNLYIKEVADSRLVQLLRHIFLNTDSRICADSIGNNEQFFTWISQVVTDVFEDPVCGNGVCETPDVASAWTANPNGLDLSKFRIATGDTVEIKYSYNLYSETMGAYILDSGTSSASITVDVPDGNFRLDLFQNYLISPDILDEDISTYASISSDTMVKHNKSFDFQYGDPAEAIATVASLNRQLQTFCTRGIQNSSQCCKGCQGRYEPVSTGDLIRNMYGLTGNVSILNGMQKQAIISFPFCALTPPGISDGARIDPKFCNIATTSTSQRRKCYDGTILAQQFQCPTSYFFSIWSYGPARNVTVAPPQVPRKRTLTPFNNVIGGIIITQYVRKSVKCPQENSESIRLLTGQYTCEAEGLAYGPMGIDPVFQPTSVLYNGTLKISDYYADNERWNVSGSDSTQSPRRYPFAFFPHQWDAGGLKSPALTSPESVGLYKLFLDARLSAEQAGELVVFMKDGMFLSNKTDWIEFEIITYNADFNLFGILTLQFRWDLGGNTLWDYQYNTALLSPYEGLRGQISLSLDLMFGIMLLADIIRECRDIYHAVLRENLVRGYILKFWNWVEWTQYGLLTSCFGFWTVYNQYIASIQFKQSYPVLKDLGASARYFATDPQNEYELLDFTIKMRKLSELKNFWTALNCVNILIFVMRFLKLLDFQPRMSLITRTLQVASVDLGHYLALFCIIFVGYATIGTILLGDRMKQFQTFGDSCAALFMLLMGWEPETMFRNMNMATVQAKIGATVATFQVFFWTWVLIATFLMLNIVLAIIVDAFAHVKSNLKDAPTITEESVAISRQNARMFVNRLCGKEWLISDKELDKVLLSHDRGFQSREKFLKSIGQIRGAGKTKCVRIAGGLKVTDRDLEGLLEGSSCKSRKSILARVKHMIKKQRAPEARKRRMSISYTGLKEDGVEIAEDNVYRPPAPIWDLINRYGEFVSAGQDDEELLHYLEAENMKREMAMYATQDQIREHVEVVKETVETLVNFVLPAQEVEKLKAARLLALKQEAMLNSNQQDLLSKSNYIFDGILKITVVAAKRLPKLDLFSESDPYCVLLTEEDASSSQTLLACTETRSNEPNPIWNAEYSFPLKCTAETHLVVAALDRDDQGIDDLIGAIKIAICDLPMDEELDRWYRLRNDANPTRTKKALLRIKVKLVSGGAASKTDPSSEAAADIKSPAQILRRNSTSKGNAIAEELRCQHEQANSPSEDVQQPISATLYVLLVCARHLPKRRTLFSKLSLFDPYAKICFEGVEFESVVRKNTYSPDWGQSFAFQLLDVSKTASAMSIHVMDWNKYSQHEYLGSVEITEDEMDEIINQCCNGGVEEHDFTIQKNGAPLIGHDGNVSHLSLAFSIEAKKANPAAGKSAFECDLERTCSIEIPGFNCTGEDEYEDSPSDCELGPPVLSGFSPRKGPQLFNFLDNAVLRHKGEAPQGKSPSSPKQERREGFRLRQRERIAKQLAADFAAKEATGFERSDLIPSAQNQENN